LEIDEIAVLIGEPKLSSYIDRVEHSLEKNLKTGSSKLAEISLHLIRTPGKQLRPLFVLLAALSQGKSINDDVINCAAAIELVHLGTVVHDDIIDNSLVRRGKPTVNAKEGINQAILVGDYLLALASVIASGVSKEVGLIISNVIAEMSEGQSLEVSDEYNPDRSIDDYLITIQKKTALLTSAALRIGALCSSSPEAHIEALAKYGDAFGMGFQLTDDLLDLLSSSKLMGKPVGNDIKEGVYTMPVLLALKKDPALKSWLGEKPKIKYDHAAMISLLKESGSLESTLKEIINYNRQASATLNKLNKNKIIDCLSVLPNLILEQSLRKQNIIKL
jgi:geranylgeranyl pyrophosphate synthase